MRFLFKANAICALNVMDTYKTSYSIRAQHLKQCNTREKKWNTKKVQFIVVRRVQELAGRHNVTGVGEGI